MRHVRCEPAPRPDDRLQKLSRVQIGPKKNPEIIFVGLNHVHHQRLPRVEVPDLIRPQPVKRRKVLPLQQKINRRRNRPRSTKPRRQRLPRNQNFRAISLPEIPALRMRLKLQLLDPIPGIPVSHSARSPKMIRLDTHAILFLVPRGPRASALFTAAPPTMRRPYLRSPRKERGWRRCEHTAPVCTRLQLQQAAPTHRHKYKRGDTMKFQKL